MKIQLKRSNVLDGGTAKQPTAGQMEYGEIAVNYNDTDPVLFIKDSNDSIIRIAGAGASGSFDGDYNNLTNKPTIGDGQITIKSGGTEIGTFTVNQEGTTDIDIPATSWGDIDEKPIYIDTDAPDSPSNGDLWVDLNECPPELKIWSDCSGTGQWEGIEGTPALAVLTPVLSGNPAQDEVLTSTLGQAVGGKEPFIYVYNFQDEDDNVLQATAANTYTLVSADVGKTVTVSVTATDSRGTVETSSKSNAIGPIVPPEEVNTPTLLTPANSSTDLSVNSITLTCSAYSGVESVYASTTWQVSTVADFSSTVYDVTNSNETSNAATFNPALDYEGTYYARCKHTSSNGIASDFSNVNTFTTEADPVDPNFPSATMSGLRFEGNRKTYLGASSTNISSKFTFSCWHKHLGATGTNTILNVANKDIAIEAQSSGAYSIDVGGINFTSSAGVATKNVWQHVVVSYDDSEVTLYVNGDEIGSTSGTEVISDGVITIGSYKGSSNWFSGYLSEVYFADGEALEPTAFGETFPDGRWGPLNNNEIKSNIGSFGTNGFYLPFDPTNTGANYSPRIEPSTDAIKGFDGNLTTEYDSGSNPWTFYLPEDTVINSLEVYGIWTRSSTVTFSVGGTSDSVSTNGTKWYSFPGLAGATITSVNKLTMDRDSSESHNFTAIKLNGELLVDHSSIGVDASGNKNNFHDENLNINSTGANYSSKCSGVTTFQDPLINGFNGSKQSMTRWASGTLTFDISEFTGSHTVTIHPHQTDNSNSSSSQVLVIDANGTQTFQMGTGNKNAGALVFNADVVNPVSIQFVKTDGTYLGFYAIEVDSEILVEPQFLDTVTDTPMMSYATLREGTNGNLVGSSATTGVVSYRGEVGVQYYYEADGVGVIATGEVPSVSNSLNVAYNFGQQPFVDPNVTAYNQATGVVTIGSDTYDTLFQTWDEYATFGLFVYDANQGKAIRTFELNKTYGIRDALTAANIFRLTAQPRYTVISYIENNGEYSPLEDVSEQLIAANATIVSLQSELDTTQAELTTASESISTGLTARAAIEVDVAAILARLSGLEADEIVDDATDTTLLTAFASLVARVEALENA